MWTLTILLMALVVVACIAAHRRGRRQAARWRVSTAREDAPRGGKA